MRPLISLLLAAPLVFAGCVTPPEVESAAAANDALLATGTVDTPLTFDGSFGPGVVACPMVTCGNAEPLTERVAPVDHNGNVSAVSLTMTWDAVSPTMETLRLGISWGNQGDAEWSYASVDGTSPLVLEEAVEIGADQEIYVWAWMPATAPMGVAYATTPQDFHVEGTLSTTEASA